MLGCVWGGIERGSFVLMCVCVLIVHVVYCFFPTLTINKLLFLLHSFILFIWQFRTLSITVECMYSLLNGDDMFATYRALSGANRLIKIFSQIYLYTFISLFIYVVLSLFIAVIMDTYETVKVSMILSNNWVQKVFRCFWISRLNSKTVIVMLFSINDIFLYRFYKVNIANTKRWRFISVLTYFYC